MSDSKPVIVIGGPTASGKSAFAVDLRRTKTSRQAYHPSEFPTSLAEALRAAKPDPACAALDHLMDD